ncbi:internal scaffolding protein [Microviridae sp.]|nr:internal scaffolding protein [Microviridae sp.]
MEPPATPLRRYYRNYGSPIYARSIAGRLRVLSHAARHGAGCRPERPVFVPRDGRGPYRTGGLARSRPRTRCPAPGSPFLPSPAGAGRRQRAPAWGRYRWRSHPKSIALLDSIWI